MSRKGAKKGNGDRLTVSLRSGQRKVLEAIALENHVSLAFAVRYALDAFLDQHKGGQLKLKFPRLGE